jgi:PAS domain S-box-containing protein
MAEKPTYEELESIVNGLKAELVKSKQVEKALRENKEKLNAMLQSIADHMSMMDKELNIIWANETAKKIFGNDIIGKKCFEVYHRRNRPCEPYPCLTLKTFQDGKVHEHYTEVIDKNGEIIYFHCTANFALRDKEGKPKAVIEISRDITKQKRAEEKAKKLEAKLQMAQKMESISTLAGGVAHDFNNLLMSIQGNTSLMLIDIDSLHPHYKRLKSIEKQVQSGAKLTSHLLGYARKGKYEVKAIDPNQLLEDILETFARTRKEITIQQDFAEDLFAIKADAGQIEQVFLNIFINASDAMHGGGNLILRSINVTHKEMKGKLYKPKPGNYVLLTVTDTGIGMDKKTIERIFDPFFTTKEMGRGTGLGLASAYGIIKAHGGHIDVESKKGQGTTFSIYMPASKRKVRKVTKTSDNLIKGAQTVLLVDDEEIIQKVCKELLEAIGYRIFTAKDGKEALKLYKKNQDKIDLVLLDMTMPNMSGSEVYDRMKEMNPNIKVLLSSGYSIDGEATEILERGCNGFIQKPFNLNALSQKIRKILEKKYL